MGKTYVCIACLKELANRHSLSRHKKLYCKGIKSQCSDLMKQNLCENKKLCEQSTDSYSTDDDKDVENDSMDDDNEVEDEEKDEYSDNDSVDDDEEEEDNVDVDEDENEDEDDEAEDEESCNTNDHDGCIENDNGKSRNKPKYYNPAMQYHYGIDAMIVMDKVRGIKRGIRVKNK